jgi:hypothetical protein
VKRAKKDEWAKMTLSPGGKRGVIVTGMRCCCAGEANVEVWLVGRGWLLLLLLLSAAGSGCCEEGVGDEVLMVRVRLARES